MKKYTLIFLITWMSVGCGSEAKQPITTGSLVERVSQILNENYVDKSIAKAITDHLLKNQEVGKYDVLEGGELINAINLDIHAIHNDRHIQVVNIKNSKRLPWPKSFITTFKVLEGNIGYLRFSHFPNPNDEVFQKIASAFNLLADTDGIIIDLRDNGGGHPDVVSNILGYFVDKDVVYEKFHVPSENKTFDYQVHKKVLGHKLVNKPLRILVNEKTASSAEIFAFAVQNLKIGKLYGATTMGLVSLSEYYPVNDSIYLLASKGMQKNPFSTEGIEGIGVTPDNVVSKRKSLQEAQLSLIRNIHGAKYGDWVSQRVVSPNHQINPELLDEYVGRYQDFVISNEGGTLLYHDPSGFEYELEALNDSLFRLKEVNDDRFRLIFEKEAGQIELVKKYFDGTLKKMPRSD